MSNIILGKIAIILLAFIFGSILGFLAKKYIFLDREESEED